MECIPGHAWHKKIYKEKKRQSIGQQPGIKSASRPAIEPVSNRSSTGRCVPPSVYNNFRLFVLLEIRSRVSFRCIGGVRESLVSRANCSVGVRFCLDSPRRPAVRSNPTRPWYVRYLDSTGSTASSWLLKCRVPGKSMDKPFY